MVFLIILALLFPVTTSQGTTSSEGAETVIESMWSRPARPISERRPVLPLLKTIKVDVIQMKHDSGFSLSTSHQFAIPTPFNYIRLRRILI
jgi:hypothetical protein